MIKIVDLTRSEVILLQKLNKGDCTSNIKSITIRKLTEQTDMSYFTVRNLLKALEYGGFCSKGCSSGNAYTYYITGKGVETLRQLGGA